MAPPRIDIGERLAARSRRVGQCLLWTGPATRDGYGVITIGRRQHRVHRVAYERSHGPIGNGAVICHKCDNPRCIEPSHLFSGTPADNTADMIRKGRAVVRCGAAHHAIKVSHAERDTIRARRASGETLLSIADDYGVSFQTVSAICRRSLSYAAR